MEQEEGNIRSFTDLHAWQEGHQLVLSVYTCVEPHGLTPVALPIAGPPLGPFDSELMVEERTAPAANAIYPWPHGRGVLVLG